jgi:hypothetical protein
LALGFSLPQKAEIDMSVQNQVMRAPNERFVVIWREQPVCLMSGVVYYFHTEREARHFLEQCEEENQLIDLEVLG